jgi:phosphatidate cytidylyltransferase
MRESRASHEICNLQSAIRNQPRLISSSVLIWRITIGTALIVSLAVLCWLDDHAAHPGVWLFPLALLVACAAGAELGGLVAGNHADRMAATIALGSVVVVAFSGVPIIWGRAGSPRIIGQLGWPLLGIAVCLIVAFLDQMWRYRQPGEATARLACAVFGWAYVGMLMSFVVQLRIVVEERWGLVALLSLIAVVKLGDTGAYAVGRLLGRHKMVPQLSPGKTWEGAVGGLIFSCLGAWWVLEMLPHRLGLFSVQGNPPRQGMWLVYGVTVGLAGVAGDLAVSLLKRNAGVKDSSGWLPGLGGVLDVLDSILFAAPVAYVFWLTGAVGP